MKTVKVQTWIAKFTLDKTVGKPANSKLRLRYVFLWVHYLSPGAS